MFDVSQVKTEGMETFELDVDCDDAKVEEVEDEETDVTLALVEAELEVWGGTEEVVLETDVEVDWSAVELDWVVEAVVVELVERASAR